MEVTDAASARAWLATWGGKPRPGVLAGAIRGIRACIGLTKPGPRQEGYRDALSVLLGQRCKRTGRPIGANGRCDAAPAHQVGRCLTEGTDR